jgi:hypothetical protein
MTTSGLRQGSDHARFPAAHAHRHTSEREIGQIYILSINWLQLIAVLLAVVGFGSSEQLASVYGIAVTATMLATTILTYFVIRYRWRMNLLLCDRLVPGDRHGILLGKLPQAVPWRLVPITARYAVAAPCEEVVMRCSIGAGSSRSSPTMASSTTIRLRGLVEIKGQGGNVTHYG